MQKPAILYRCELCLHTRSLPPAEDHCVSERADGHGSRCLLLRAYAVFVVCPATTAICARSEKCTRPSDLLFASSTSANSAASAIRRTRSMSTALSSGSSVGASDGLVLTTRIPPVVVRPNVTFSSTVQGNRLTYPVFDYRSIYLDYCFCDSRYYTRTKVSLP